MSKKTIYLTLGIGVLTILSILGKVYFSRSGTNIQEQKEYKNKKSEIIEKYNLQNEIDEFEKINNKIDYDIGVSFK